MWSVIEAAEAVRAGRLKAAEVLDECLGRIEAANPSLNAFVHLDVDGARQRAEQIDATVAAGRDPGPLAGVPFGVKDLEDCAGMPTSHGSLLYKGRGPVDHDSLHVARLRAAGAVPVGKTAAPEFGAVAFTATKAWGVTRNPWDPAVTPGGSSGGSAAAVASGMVPFCTASDGGGSTRIPASFTGLVGFKANFGRIPHPGFGGMSETTVLGALTTTVADAARHLDVAAGPHDADRASLPAPGLSYEAAIEELEVAGLRALWSVDLGFAAVDPEVAAVAEEAAMALIEAAGLRQVSRPVELTDPVRVWLSAGAADLWTDLEPGMWPEHADQFERYVSRGLEATADHPVSRFARAHLRRTRLDAEVAELFGDADVIITPTTAVPAFGAEGRTMPRVIAGRDVAPTMAVPFTMVANLCWNPAISLPAGQSAGGLPIGLQVMVRHHADELALRLGRIFEQARPWPRLAPGWE